MEKVALSIIIPVFDEEESIKELCQKLETALVGINKSYEIIFIDDGSTDNTLNVIREVNRSNNKFKSVSFRRNFGKSAALMAGFEHAQGDIIITMDGDLQDDPAEIPRFLAKMDGHHDLVVGWKARRKDPVGKKMVSKIFNRLTAMLTGVRIHDFNCCFKIFTRDVAKNIRVHGELYRYIPALAYWHGYRVSEIEVKHNARKYGKSKYGFSRLFKGFLDLITVKFMMSYLTRPIHFFGQAGLFLLFLGGALGIVSLIFKFVFDMSLSSSQLPLLTVFLIIVGIQFILMGLLAEILIRIYYEPRGKSPYSIKEKINL